jgi:hypothetical protein
MCARDLSLHALGVRAFVLIALCTALPIGAAFACGPDFPQNLLDDRKASLLDLPEGTFDFEAAHLLPKPDDHLHTVEGSPWEDFAEARAKAEAPGLSADELTKVAVMRAAPNMDAAAAAGAGLAPELLDYTLGAIAFKHAEMTKASAHFERVLALPTMQRTRRGLWAQYMLGRALLASGDTDGAIASFEVVREHALIGAADPLGLAVASFGEQARIQWHHGNVAAAVKTYATQAAHGSRSGRASLLFVTRSILAHPELLDRALDDPLTQRLLAAYFYTRSDEFAMGWPLAGTRTEANDEAGDAAAGSVERKPSGGVDIAGFIAAVQRHGLDHFDGADRLAAGAYRTGRYPLAAQLAAKSMTPLAAWVRAKLALRAGDQATALREYADAARGFPVDESWSNDDSYSDAVDSPRCRVETERGVLALGRGEYVDAMARLFAGAKEHWPDAAYVAERVLTVDELKGFVEKNVPAMPKRATTVQGDSLPSTPSEQLRALLARRLLRVGRDEEALAYFDDPALRKKAMTLIAARRNTNAWTRIGQAEAIYKQAQLTRSNGMELLGTELAPDYAMWDGDYTYDEFKLQPADFVGKAEPKRVQASVAMPNERYHYRYVAAGLAEQAAGLVPPRSQAYAALMCEATAWVIDTDSKRAAALYGQYLHVGAHVAWGRNFGRVCPQPDFHSAPWLPWKQRYWQARHWAKHGWPLGLAALGALIVLVALRKRRRTVA